MTWCWSCRVRLHHCLRTCRDRYHKCCHPHDPEGYKERQLHSDLSMESQFSDREDTLRTSYPSTLAANNTIEVVDESLQPWYKRCCPCFSDCSHPKTWALEKRLRFAMSATWFMSSLAAFIYCLVGYSTPFTSTSTEMRSEIETPRVRILFCVRDPNVMDITVFPDTLGLFASMNRELVYFDRFNAPPSCTQSANYSKLLQGKQLPSLLRGSFTMCLRYDVVAMIDDGCIPKTASATFQTQATITPIGNCTLYQRDFVANFGPYFVPTCSSFGFLQGLPGPSLLAFVVDENDDRVLVGPGVASSQVGYMALRPVVSKTFGASFLSDIFQIYDTSLWYEPRYTSNGQIAIYPIFTFFVFWQMEFGLEKQFSVLINRDEVSFGILNVLGFIGGTRGLFYLLYRYLVSVFVPPPPGRSRAGAWHKRQRSSNAGRQSVSSNRRDLP